MAGIPPNWLGSIIQTQGAAQRSASDRAREGAAQTESGGGSFADKLQDVIEATDRDSQVYSDAEGQGSQGRPSGDEGDERSPGQSGQKPAEPPGGLDVEA